MSRKISKIRLQDFQNHKDTTLELHPNLNLFTGSSDSGKSAQVRALIMAYFDIFRKPDIRDGCKNSSVSITYANGDYYLRTKGEVNEIEIQYEGKAVEVYSKFGKAFPKEVKDFIGNIPKTSNSYLPFATQEDKLFLVNVSDESLHKEISKLLGIDDLEDAASYLNTQNNKTSVEIKKVNEEIAKTKDKLEPYENLDEKISKLEILKNLITDYDLIQEDINSISTIQAKLRKIKEKSIDCHNQIEQENTIITFFDDHIVDLENHFTDMEGGLILLENLSNVKNKIKNVQSQIDYYENISNGDIGSLIDECQDIYVEYGEMKILDKSIQETNRNVSDTELLIENTEKQITDLENSIKELELYLEENFEFCSECGNEL